MSVRSIVPRSIGFLIMLGQWGILRETGSTGRKNAPVSLSFLSERIVDRQKRCCKERIVDMLVPIGVGGAGVGLETTVSPLVCIEDAVTGGGQPVFRVGRRKFK
jgi:hypothetical protein